MIQKEKLVQFYFSQYRDSAMALKKKNNDGKKTYEQRIGRLITEMQRTKTGKLTQPHLEEYHRQIRNMAYYALKQKNQYAIMQIRDILMPELVRLDIGTLREEEQELVTSRLRCSVCVRRTRAFIWVRCVCWRWRFMKRCGNPASPVRC